MDAQPIQKAPKYTKNVLIVTRVCTAVALAMTIAGFFTCIVENGDKTGIFKFVSTGASQGRGFAGGLTAFLFFFVMYILPQTIALIWSVIPKKWAAVVGTVYAALLAAWSSWFYSSVVNSNAYLMGSIIFRKYASYVLLVLSVAKIVIISMDKKKSRQS